MVCEINQTAARQPADAEGRPPCLGSLSDPEPWNSIDWSRAAREGETQRLEGAFTALTRSPRDIMYVLLWCGVWVQYVRSTEHKAGKVGGWLVMSYETPAETLSCTFLCAPCHASTRLARPPSTAETGLCPLRSGAQWVSLPNM